MSTTRRRLAAAAFPALLLAALPRGAGAKSAGPLEACEPGDPAKRCRRARDGFVADDALDGGGCPHCAGKGSGKPGEATASK